MVAKPMSTFHLLMCHLGKDIFTYHNPKGPRRKLRQIFFDILPYFGIFSTVLIIGLIGHLQQLAKIKLAKNCRLKSLHGDVNNERTIFVCSAHYIKKKQKTFVDNK